MSSNREYKLVMDTETPYRIMEVVSERLRNIPRGTPHQVLLIQSTIPDTNRLFNVLQRTKTVFPTFDRELTMPELLSYFELLRKAHTIGLRWDLNYGSSIEELY
jgi:hypothetical protein